MRVAPTNLIPFAIILAYTPGELFLEGVTAYNLATGLILFGLSFFIFRPKSIARWAVMAIIFVAIELIFTLVNFIPKFEISRSPSWPSSLPIISLVLLVLLLIQIFSTIRLRTIQSRMLIIIISLSIIPALISHFLFPPRLYVGIMKAIGRTR